MARRARSHRHRGLPTERRRPTTTRSRSPQPPIQRHGAAAAAAAAKEGQSGHGHWRPGQGCCADEDTILAGSGGPRTHTVLWSHCADASVLTIMFSPTRLCVRRPRLRTTDQRIETRRGWHTPIPACKLGGSRQMTPTAARWFRRWTWSSCVARLPWQGQRDRSVLGRQSHRNRTQSHRNRIAIASQSHRNRIAIASQSHRNASQSHRNRIAIACIHVSDLSAVSSTACSSAKKGAGGCGRAAQHCPGASRCD